MNGTILSSKLIYLIEDYDLVTSLILSFTLKIVCLNEVMFLL